MVHYALTAIGFIAWVVFITQTDIHQKQSKSVSSIELHQHQSADVAAVTSLDISDKSIVSSTAYDAAVDHVGLLCSLTTMLFFAAPFSNLVSVMTHSLIVCLSYPLHAIVYFIKSYPILKIKLFFFHLMMYLKFSLSAYLFKKKLILYNFVLLN